MISELLSALPFSFSPIGDTMCYGENALWTDFGSIQVLLFPCISIWASDLKYLSLYLLISKMEICVLVCGVTCNY